MSTQLTVRLSDPLSHALDAAAVEMQRKRSEIVRLALRKFLGLRPPDDRSRADRVRHLLGSLETGIPDLAERHREYVLESLKDDG